MRIIQSMPRLNILYVCLNLIMCFTLLLLSGCTGSLSEPSPSSAIRIKVTPIAKTSLAQLKSDSFGINTEEASRADLEKVQQIMARMSLEQKLGQLIVVEYLGSSYQGENGGLQYMISQQFVGGYMYQESNRNFNPPYNEISQVAAFSKQAMHDAKIPLMIATDQEGGLVNRLLRFHGNLPSAADMAASGNPRMALTQGTLAAKWLRELGINTDFAPVVDVHTVDPPVLQTRMFGRDPQTVATYAGAFLNGLQNNGVAGCLKHFPGLGAITADPHAGLPVVYRSLKELNNIDLAPYKLMLQKDHPAMIMTTDVLMPAIDLGLPAELSPSAINGILRKQLGYDGVVITDGLYMGGISSNFTISQAAVLSIVAGNDMIEGPYTPATVAEVISAFKQALQQGTLTIARINQAVERILLLKVHYGIITL